MKYRFAKKLAVLSLAAGMLLPIAKPAVQAKAETKKEVWVVDSGKTRYMGDDGAYADAYQSKYKYNKNGLLTVVKTVSGENESSIKYAYKGTKISKRLRDSSGSGEYELDETYSYNKDNRLVKSVRGSDSNYVTKFTWKNGRCIKDALPYTGSENSYSYDKNGWIIEMDTGSRWAMKYDKRGYMVSENSDAAAYLYKNKYKDGLLESRIELDGSGNESGMTSYKYKKINVPASYVKQVKLQQEWLTNKGGKQLFPLAVY